MAPDRQEKELYLRPPRGPRGQFKIIRRKRANGYGRSQNETIESPALEAINKKLLEGGYSLEEAREAARRELLRLRKLASGGRTTTLRSANLKTLQKYWDAEYAHRSIISPKASYDRLRRAVEALGDVPLTASRGEIQKAINEATKGNKQRDVAAALNQLLRWMGRTDAKLTKARKERRRPRYLEASQIPLMVGFLPEDMRLLAQAAFATGARAGELFSLEPRHFRDGVLLIEAQLDVSEVTRDTKNRRVREVVVIPEYADALTRWIATPEDQRLALRKRRHSTIVRTACRKAFGPAERAKLLTFHDLRHSYAVHLLSKGVSLSLVAQSLGDSEAVANEYYSGFVLTKPGIEAVKRALG